VIILIAGGKSTKAIGDAALHMETTCLPVPTFGGAAKEVFDSNPGLTARIGSNGRAGLNNLNLVDTPDDFAKKILRIAQDVQKETEEYRGIFYPAVSCMLAFLFLLFTLFTPHFNSTESTGILWIVLIAIPAAIFTSTMKVLISLILDETNIGIEQSDLSTTQDALYRMIDPLDATIIAVVIGAFAGLAITSLYIVTAYTISSDLNIIKADLGAQFLAVILGLAAGLDPSAVRDRLTKTIKKHLQNK